MDLVVPTSPFSKEIGPYIQLSSSITFFYDSILRSSTSSLGSCCSPLILYLVIIVGTSCFSRLIAVN